jgi:hypothetical protein
MFLVALAAALVAWREYESHNRDRIMQIKQHEEDQWERTRPFVQVRYLFQQNSLFLCIENVGKTIAKDISVSFFPDLKAPKSSRDPNSRAREYFEKGVKERTISSLAPGTRFIFIIDGASEVFQHVDKGEIPEETTATVNYSDYHSREIEDKFSLSLGDWKYTIQDKTTEVLMENRLKLVATEVKGVQNKLSGILRVFNRIENSMTDTES